MHHLVLPICGKWTTHCPMSVYTAGRLEANTYYDFQLSPWTSTINLKPFTGRPIGLPHQTFTAAFNENSQGVYITLDLPPS